MSEDNERNSKQYTENDKSNKEEEKEEKVANNDSQRGGDVSNLTKLTGTGAYENQGRILFSTQKTMTNDNEIKEKVEEEVKNAKEEESKLYLFKKQEEIKPTTTTTTMEEIKPKKSFSSGVTIVRRVEHISEDEITSSSDFSSSNVQNKGQGNADGSLKPGGGGGSSWLEEIQFKAQYQHFRSMNYASIVNSTPSLETTNEPEVVNIRIGGDLTSKERHSLCWNFPRVNFRRLFNAKSLEDILGRSRKGSHESQLKFNNAHHTQSNSNLAASRNSRGYSNSKVISVTPPVLSTASSENNCYYKRDKGQQGYDSESTPSSTFLKVPNPSKSTGKTKKSDKIIQKILEPRVKCAKSDNCLHSCTKLVSSSVDNLDSPTTTIERKARTSESRERDKQGGQQGDSNNINEHFKVKLSVPAVVQVKQLEGDSEGQEEQLNSSTTPNINEKDKAMISQNRKLVVTKIPPPKKTQVSPSDRSGCVIGGTKQKMTVETNNILKTTKQTGESTNQDVATKEKPRLVVANVSYLQRPISPTPAPFLVTSQTQLNLQQNREMSSPTLPGTCFLPYSTSSPLSTVSTTNNTTKNNVFNRNNFFGSDGSKNNIFSLSSPRDKCANSSSPFSYNDPHSNPFQSHSMTSNLERQQQQGNFVMKNSSSRGCKSDDDDKVGSYYYSPENVSSQTSFLSRAFHSEQINNNNNPIRLISPGLCAEQQRLQSKCDYSHYPRSKSTERPQRDYSNPTSYQPYNQGAVTDRSRRKDSIGDGMGDLQSPQYVKRTAHMFDTGHLADSRYTTQINGSGGKEFGKDEASENGSSHHHQNQPSYLNVSRSVCGYSCLSYNGTTTTTTTIGCKHRTSGVHSDFQLSYRPATLQANNYNKLESKLRGNNPTTTLLPKNGTTSTPEIENNHNNTAGYTQNRCTSNILEKIERLYGSNAASVRSSALWRRPVPLLQMPSSAETATTTTIHRTIPASNLQSVNERFVSSSRKGEKIIPISIEKSPSPPYQQQRTTERRYGEGGHDMKSLPMTIQQRTVQHSSSIDKDSDKIEEGLYLKHDILNANQRRGEKHNGHELINLECKYDANNQTSAQDRRSLEREGSSSEGAHKITSRSSKSSIQNSVSVTTADRTISPLPSTEKFDKNIILDKIDTTIMVSDKSPPLFNIHKENISEQNIMIHPHQKTEDTIDGESKQLFNRVVCNLSPELNEEDAGSNKRIPNLTTTTPMTKGIKENICGSGEPEEKNGEHFLNVIRHERSRIEEMIKEAEARLETLDASSEDSVDFEFSGKILATIGKARLLINKKFKQFEGLCNDNIEQRKKGVGSDEPFTTKNEDLEGFWDMVLIQVDQIHSMFQNLDGSEGTKTVASKSLKTGNRKPTQKALTTSTSPKTAASKPGNSTRDEIRRKMLAERREAMKKQMAAQQSPSSPTDPNSLVQIFIPDSSSPS